MATGQMFERCFCGAICTRALAYEETAFDARTGYAELIVRP